MFCKLSVALLLIAAPGLAQDAPPANQPESEAATPAKPLPYKLKKVCRAQDVVGSSIPRTVCTTKRVYLKPGEEAQASSNGTAEPQSRP